MSQPFYTLDDLRHWQDIAPTLSPPARLAVIGDPIAHSRSPQMHNPALRACGIDAQYIRVHVPVSSVKEAFSLFLQNDFIGVNCTIPHKFEALDEVDDLNELATLLGAVNTVRFSKENLNRATTWPQAAKQIHTVGFNSDGPGFLNSVEEAFQQKVNELRVLILGAGGGAGSAVAKQCSIAKCPSIVLVNRTIEKLKSLKGELVSYCHSTHVEEKIWNDASLAGVLPNVDLIVNSTPLGMKVDDPPPFDLSLLQPWHLVYDMVYTSGRSTPFIARAKEIGARTCEGFLLLLHQGAISFEHWFNQPAPIEAMRAGLKESAP